MKSSWRGYKLQVELDQSGLSWAIMLSSIQVLSAWLSALGINFSMLSFSNFNHCEYPAVESPEVNELDQ